VHGYPAASPYSYNLLLTDHGGMPAGTIRQVSRDSLAKVDTQYRALGEPGSGKVFSFPAGLPVLVSGLPVDLPMRRMDYYTPGDWHSNFYIPAADASQTSDPATYQAGNNYRSEWGVAVIAPKLMPVPTGTGTDRAAVSRSADTISAYSDAVPGRHALVSSGYDTGDLRLSRDGHEIGDPGSPDGVTWQVPADNGTYQLRLQTGRTSTAWHLSTKVNTIWTFRSTHGNEALPLLGLSYCVPLDESNRMDAHHPAPFTVSVARQETAGTTTIRQVRVWTSFDDGTTWQALTVQRTTDGWRVIPPNGGQPGASVSLRVAATDTEGNEVDQTVTRAYRPQITAVGRRGGRRRSRSSEQRAHESAAFYQVRGLVNSVLDLLGQVLRPDLASLLLLRTARSTTLPSPAERPRSKEGWCQSSSAW
jgi:hypothetical protein